MTTSLPGLSTVNASFVHRRVNQTTFLTIENDDYSEQPHIYVKIYQTHLVITDTGCNAPRCKESPLAFLRAFIETQPLYLNNNRPLNPDGTKAYIMICSHCHYDHILGLPQFLNPSPTIVASNFDKPFILEDLPTHSLCQYINIATPEYQVPHWANHTEYFSLSGIPFRIQFLHIPGHTPDSSAWYDINKHYLYVSDTFYKCTRAVPIPELGDGAQQVSELLASQGAIIFPEQDWIAFISSLELLLSFVLHRNHELKIRQTTNKNHLARVKVACGHLTYNADAELMIIAAKNSLRKLFLDKSQLEVAHAREGSSMTSG